MDEYRKKHEKGELDVPLSLPRKRKQDEDEADMRLEYSTVGEYTKSPLQPRPGKISPSTVLNSIQ